ncbi:NRPS protein biosynthetic cluster [Salix suchowensis]|nr:NRPS protein biosynthetic cluster [Salix suchowensis]
MKVVDIVIATPSMLVPHDPADYPNIKVVAVAGEVCPQHRHHVGGGAGITKGYVNLPEKTEERYKLDPFMDDGSYMFNTGDLGRWREDGSLEHLGRIDDQVKIKVRILSAISPSFSLQYTQGFRVELDGVSAAMETCAGVKNAAALLIGDTLWGFYTPQLWKSKRALESTEKSIVEKVVVQAAKRKSRSCAEQCRETVIHSGSDLRATPVYRRHPQSLDLVLAQAAATKPSLASSSETSSTVEQGLAWAGYEDDEIPEKTQGKYVRNLRHQIFSLYRRLFGVVFVVNLGILIATLVKGGANSLELGQIVIANLFCAILMRQDYVINAFFNVFCAVRLRTPTQ